jgi:RimJ/RimL family protein N-acetyltransferase
VRTPRLALRCWSPADAPLLAEAIESSLEHLRPWMPWAAEEPKSLADRVRLLRTFRGEFDLGRNFVYAIFDPEETSVLGGTGLHPRADDDSLEIGYWIRVDRVGGGLATEASAALTRVAFEVCAVDRVDIRCDPANAASRAVPRKLGFAEEATLRRRLAYPEPRDLVVYSLFRDEYRSTPVANAELEAFDAAGERVL